MNTRQARAARKIAKTVIQEREQYRDYLLTGEYSYHKFLTGSRPLPLNEFLDRVAEPVHRKIEAHFEWWTQ